MPEIYVYKYLDSLEVWSSSIQIPPRHKKGRWFLYSIPSLAFEVTIANSPPQTYTIPSSDAYALFKEELIPISNASKKVLLVSDVDGTIIFDTQESLTALDEFTRFWIKNFMFNGSRLVYNTGRPIDEYLEHRETLMDPDTCINVIGTGAHEFDESGTPIAQSDYNQILKEHIDDYWHSQALYESILEKFDFLRDCWVRLVPTRVLFQIPDKYMPDYMDLIKQYVANSENESRHGHIVKGKVLISKQFLIDTHFVDLVPAYSGKHLGIIYSQIKYGFTNEETIFAGDSPIDIDGLKYPVTGVIVGNAEPRLVAWLNKKPRHLTYQSSLNFGYAIMEALNNFIRT